MSATFVIDGVDELRAAFRELPTNLANEGAEIVDTTGEIAASSLKQVYPIGPTGHLRQGVSVKLTRNRFGAVSTVTSRSPHAQLWEFGTQVRHTRQGWNRGRMPSHRDEGLVAIATRGRRQMNAQLVALVQRAGFEVTGDV